MTEHDSPFRRAHCQRIRRTGWLTLSLLLAICIVIPALSMHPAHGHQAVASTPDAPAGQSSAIHSTSLPNAIRIHSRVITGGQPGGLRGFETLRDLGVRTVISVDGVRPDVDAARQYGLRYIHLPHGYDGISDERLFELGHAMLTEPGPIYVHCHHGRHRSPAAAAAGCIVAGLISVEEGLAVLQQAGTGAAYRGLWRCVEGASPADPRQLTTARIRFSESIEPPPMIQAMVELETTLERLEHLAARGWKHDPQHPDLSPPHEALLLRERLTEMVRLESLQQLPAGFRSRVEESAAQARILETLLNGDNEPRQAPQADGVIHRIRRQCRDCHQQFRN